MPTDPNTTTTKHGVAARKVVVVHSVVARMILAIIGIHIELAKAIVVIIIIIIIGSVG